MAAAVTGLRLAVRGAGSLRVARHLSRGQLKAPSVATRGAGGHVRGINTNSALNNCAGGWAGAQQWQTMSLMSFTRRTFGSLSPSALAARPSHVLFSVVQRSAGLRPPPVRSLLAMRGWRVGTNTPATPARRWLSNETGEKKGSGSGNVSSPANSVAAGSGNVAGSVAEAAATAAGTGERPTFRVLLKRYGAVFFGTYMAVYVSTLLLLYTGLETGVLLPKEMVQNPRAAVDKLVNLLEYIGFPDSIGKAIRSNHAYTNLALAWVATKITEPLRMIIAIALTPKLARMFGRAPAVLPGQRLKQAQAIKKAVSERMNK
eukprot:m.162602 g.162602  ORF g.162602 m.162602 type:complete len:317 (+) comp17668_c1_seq1:342-1292(+)